MPTLGHGDGHASIELIAALILVIGGTIFIAISLRTRPARPAPAGSPASEPGGAPSPSVRRSLAFVLAGLSAGAAFIHLVAAPSHVAEIGGIAVGFVIAAAFQGAWTVACLARPSRRLVAIGIAGNVALLAAWAWTRTLGLPLPGAPGGPEPIGLADGAAVAFELLLIAGCLARRFDLDLALGRRPGAPTIASIALVPVLGLVLIVTSLATVALTGDPDHGAEAPHAAAGAIGRR